ncbi:ladderlectin-like [Amphiprion ocellaris]|uniref:C-type lectin domain-containing protein n=1 Tax=Amphiprion ocellaris TaxID=80972 RepID=A0A3Q1BPM6_AMPOC|nr:ladderlectin-like [Amphiprion ocellaris]
MKTLSVCLLLCVVTTLTRAAAVPEAAAKNDQVAKSHLFKRSASCSGGWSEFNGRCFRYVPRPMTWAKAEKNCQAFGGNLASVHDITEYHELQRLIMTASYEYKETWIGGSDAQQENVFLWSDGRPFHYTNWCPGEPNNGRTTQHCVQMNFGDTKCWDDLQCSYRRPSVCAKKI